MELTCPCGNGYLIRKVTTKGPNMTRPYYKCPGSNKENNIIDCEFYSFEDKLRRCPCGRGFCRTRFRRDNKKYWRCCVLGDGGCRFFEIITSTWQPPSSSTPPPQSLSPSSRSSQSPSSSQGARSNASLSLSIRSSQPPSSSQGARSNARKYELLVRSLQVERSSSKAYLELIKEFADCGLEN